MEGLVHAFKSERNLRHFILAHIFLMLVFVWFGVHDLFQLLFIAMIGGFFVVVELINSAIERLTDTIDDMEKSRKSGNFHPGIKMSKDVAAAASLVALVIYAIIMLMLAADVYDSLTNV